MNVNSRAKQNGILSRFSGILVGRRQEAFLPLNPKDSSSDRAGLKVLAALSNPKQYYNEPKSI